MKKLCFLTVLAAIMLTGCNTDHTATVIYNDVPPPLTVKTFSESLPPETYSEYMETYTPSESGTTNMYDYPAGMNGDIFADTGITLPPADSGVNTGTGDSMEIYGDTVPTAPTVTAMPEPVPDTLPETTAPVVRKEDSETVTCVTVSGESMPDTGETSETTVTTVFSLIIPKADTGNYRTVSAVTAPERVSTGSTGTQTEAVTETSE